MGIFLKMQRGEAGGLAPSCYRPITKRPDANEAASWTPSGFSLAALPARDAGRRSALGLAVAPGCELPLSEPRFPLSPVELVCVGTHGAVGGAP